MLEIKNPHDLYFRDSMKDLRIAKEFIKRYLSQEICSRIDFTTLQLRDSKFIDERLKELIVDILYSVNIDGEEGYIYLLVEHQSTMKRFMPLRLLQYVFYIMSHHIDDLGHKELPIIVPMVFYNGEKPYNQPLDIFELFGKNEALARELLFKPFKLMDLTTIPDEDLRKRRWSGIMEFATKHIWEEDFRLCFNQLLLMMKEVMTSSDDPFIISTLRYVLDRAELKDDDEKIIEAIKKELSPKLGETVMSLSEKWKKEGEINAMKSVAYKLIMQDLTDEQISNVTGLSLEEIRILRKTKING